MSHVPFGKARSEKTNCEMGGRRGRKRDREAMCEVEESEKGGVELSDDVFR